MSSNDQAIKPIITRMGDDILQATYYTVTPVNDGFDHVQVLTKTFNFSCKSHVDIVDRYSQALAPKNAGTAVHAGFDVIKETQYRHKTPLSGYYHINEEYVPRLSEIREMYETLKKLGGKPSTHKP